MAQYFACTVFRLSIHTGQTTHIANTNTNRAWTNRQPDCISHESHPLVYDNGMFSVVDLLPVVSGALERMSAIMKYCLVSWQPYRHQAGVLCILLKAPQKVASCEDYAHNKAGFLLTCSSLDKTCENWRWKSIMALHGDMFCFTRSNIKLSNRPNTLIFHSSTEISTDLDAYAIMERRNQCTMSITKIIFQNVSEGEWITPLKGNIQNNRFDLNVDNTINRFEHGSDIYSMNSPTKVRTTQGEVQQTLSAWLPH